MKKFAVGSVFVLLMAGCTQLPEEPSLRCMANLTVESIDKGLGLKLQWDKVKDAEGYYVSFIKITSDTTADTSGLCKVLCEYFCDSPYDPNLGSRIENRGCGTYFVYPVKRTYDEDYTGDTLYISSMPNVLESQIMYEKTVGDSNAFRWDSNGDGSVCSITDTDFHVYLSDQDSSVVDTSKLHFVSPAHRTDATTAPNPSDTTTMAGPYDDNEADYCLNPADMINTYAPGYNQGIEEEEIYFLYVKNSNCVKVVVDSVLENRVKFDAYYQPIPGFRRF